MENIIYKLRREIFETALYIVALALIIFLSSHLCKARIQANKTAFLDYAYIYNDVNVNDVNLGGLTKQEALEVLEKEVQEVYNAREVNLLNPITSEVYNCNFGMCGADYNFEKAVEDAYAYGRTGNAEEDFKTVYTLKNVSYFTHAEYETNEQVLSELLDTLSQKIESENGVKINKSLAIKSIKTIVDTAIPGDVVLPIEYEA